MKTLLSIIILLAFGGGMYWLVTSQPKQEVYKEESTEMVLPSGKKIKVLEYTQIYNPAAKQDDQVVMFIYETKIPLTDVAALQKEVDEVWSAIKPRVQSDNYYNAIISANEPYTGKIVTHKKSQEFTYKRNSNGTWNQI